MLAHWNTSPEGLKIERPRSTGPEQRFVVRSFASVSSGGMQYWSLIVDGARELYLCEEDVVALEAHFALPRFELGGAELSSPAADGEAAITEVIAPGRAAALETFAPRLIEAMTRSLQASSPEPLQAFLSSDPRHSACTAWLAQALVRISRSDEATWNETAIDALRSYAPADAELELDRVPVDFGFQRVVLALCREGAEAVVCVDGVGGAAVLVEDGWSPVAFPPSAAVLVQRALDAMESADLDEAIDAFAQAEELLEGAERMQARGNRAALLSRLGEHDVAIGLLVHNTEEFPDAAESWYALGLALVKLGRYDESVAATERAIALDDSHANAHYSIACALAQRGGPADRERAIEHVGAALACDEDLRESIAEDEDFATLRDDPRFLAAVSGA